MNHTAREVLHQYWDFENFRPLQEDIINAVLQNKDVLAVLPTGAGKSICFQVPALMREGLCLVISPLIALMKEQTDALRKKGITAFCIHSGMNRKEVVSTFQVAAQSNCKFLYLSPERLQTNLFKEYLPSLDISLVVVDEAHCISQWGYDFRPAYLRIASLREELPQIHILALTASATREVQQDISEKLLFADQYVFRGSFERPNLCYRAMPCQTKAVTIREIVKNSAGSGIIYCSNRRRTKEIADLLTASGISSGHYHAGLGAEEREAKQKAWLKGDIRIIVATSAFGMGINKPNVRLVVHADLPDALESYYQQAGRAGRDGGKSDAVLLYTEQEKAALLRLPDLHYPAMENIRVVYKAVMNFLQIPAGSGEGNYYDFNVTGFAKTFKLDAQLVFYTLKVLEQEGLLFFNEQFYLAARAVFSVDKEMLYRFERERPEWQPLIQCLLRNYPGIFDQSVSIFEKSIAYLLRQDTTQISAALRTLDAEGIIAYEAVKDSPQLYFIQNRVRSEEFRINLPAYQERKQRYNRRIAAMLQYVETAYCRAQFIADYFGDSGARPCGVCDNCISQKQPAPEGLLPVGSVFKKLR